jgi:hypothetical protein
MTEDDELEDAIGTPTTPAPRPLSLIDAVRQRRHELAPTKEQLQKLTEKLKDKRWRMDNLYLVLDDEGKMRQFKMRPEQIELFENRHSQNFVPKARKLGMSTFLVLDAFDECMFKRDYHAGIIDLKQKDAEDKLSMAKYAWENGPKFHPNSAIRWIWKYAIQGKNPLTVNSNSRMEWTNGSGFSAGVRYTGKTPNRLHISEFGPIAAQFPVVATDIVRGSINSVHTASGGGIVDIETTMEGGRIGECYKIFQLALKAIGNAGMTNLDWKMFFFSWLGHPLYVLPLQAPKRPETVDYFARITKEHGEWIEKAFGWKGGVVPTIRQAWWEKKRETLGDLMWQQYPTVVSECDLASVSGQIYPEVTKLRFDGRVTAFAPEVHLPFIVSADLGSSVNTALWLHQPAGPQHNVIDCVFSDATQSDLKGAWWVADQIRRWEQEYGFIVQVLLPHDANITDKGAGVTYVETLAKAGISRAKIMVVPRTPDVWVGIDLVHKLLPRVWFHDRCDKTIKDRDGNEHISGLARLEGYRVKATNDGQARTMPFKDGTCDHAADGLRTYAEANAQSLTNTQGRMMQVNPGDYDEVLERRHFNGGQKGFRVQMVRP